MQRHPVPLGARPEGGGRRGADALAPVVGEGEAGGEEEAVFIVGGGGGGDEEGAWDGGAVGAEQPVEGGVAADLGAERGGGGGAGGAAERCCGISKEGRRERRISQLLEAGEEAKRHRGSNANPHCLFSVTRQRRIVSPFSPF